MRPSPGMARLYILLLLVCSAPLPLSPANPEGRASPDEQALAPGVTYSHLLEKTAAGEPWSIHVLRVQRGARSVRLRAVGAASPAGGMQRELPTELAMRAAVPGESVVAVVNGDYDMAAPYLGISDGWSVTSGRLWTTGKRDWPALALRRNGEPLIGTPQARLEMRAAGRRWRIGALNKPFGSAHGPEPRAFTAEFRASVKSERPFRAVVINGVGPALPLHLNREARGVVREVIGSANEVIIPPDGIVLGERIAADAAVSPPETAPLDTLRPGMNVRLRFAARLAGRGDLRDVVGGFPILVRGGQVAVTGAPSENLQRRHPRTAACYNHREILFVVVDGRQPQWSVGLTLEELAALMQRLGCREAMNTDGGGSSVMAVALPAAGSATTMTGRAAPEQAAPLRIVNSPSDGRERGRGNAWVILRSQ